MKKNTKIILIIASIFSFILAVLTTALVIGIFLNVSQIENFFANAYVMAYGEYNADLVQELMTSYALYGVFSAISNFMAGRVYLNLTKAPLILATRIKDTAIFCVISQLIFSIVILFPISLIAPIIASVGLLTFRIKKIKPVVHIINAENGKEIDLKDLNNQMDFNVTNNNQTTTTLENIGSPEMVKIMSDKLAELRKKHDSGECSDQEFAKRLNDIISYKWN